MCLSKKLLKIFSFSLLCFLSFLCFSCAKFVNDKIGLSAPKAPERVVITENLDKLGELTQVDIGMPGTYYSFGVYPQDSSWRVSSNNGNNYNYREITFDEDIRWSYAHPESTLADGDKYILGSDNCWYEKVVRDWYDSYNGESGTSITYYKVQPIIWQVFKELPDNKIMLVPIKALTSTEFYPLPEYNEYDRNIDGEKIYPNNYKYSKIRAFINSYDGRDYEVDDFSSSGFFKKAFNDVNRDKIFEMEVDNSINTTTVRTWTNVVEEWNEEFEYWERFEEVIEENLYVCENTFDKVFLLSHKDLEDNNFLKIYTTDYAMETGCGGIWLKDNDAWLSTYYTRSPTPDGDNSVFCANVNGYWDDNKEEYTSLYYEWGWQWCGSSWTATLPAIVIQRP